MEITIRNAKRSEWNIIQQMNVQAFAGHDAYDDALDLHWAVSEQGSKYFKKATKSPRYYCIVAEVKNTTVGYLIGLEKVYSYRTVRMAEIDTMGVIPGYQSAGIGAKLIQTYRAWAKAHGFHRIYVNAYIGNEKAIKFYKKCGLSPIDISLEGKI